jgi:hypothetical protein
MFNTTLARKNLYLDSLRRNQTTWIGVQFHFPLPWCTKKFYISIHRWNEFNEIVVWVEIEKQWGYHEEIDSWNEDCNWSHLPAGLHHTLG